jgi:chitinase
MMFGIESLRRQWETLSRGRSGGRQLTPKRARALRPESLESRRLLANGNELARIRLETTNLAGNTVASVNVGDQFLVRGWVKDLRANPQGVFSGYLDVLYNSSRASVSGPLTFGTSYGAGTSGDVSTPGLMNELGAFSTSLSPLGPAEQMLFSIQMTATATGTITFDADPADNLPANHLLLYLQDTPVLQNLIDYVDTSLIVGGPTTVWIDDVTVTEGNAGTSNAQFIVHLSQAAASPISVNYATANGSATAGSDYQTTSGSLTFAVGESSKTINVPIIGDNIFESVEGFLVNLSNAVGATITDGTAVGTIVDNDTPGSNEPPSVAINDVTILEGDVGTTAAQFTVTLSKTWNSPVTLNYATSNGSAAAGSDFQATSGSLTFAVGETSKTITVLVTNDTLFEQVEGFLVNLSNVSGATIARGTGVGTVIDNDPQPTNEDPPTIAIRDAIVVEGDSGSTNAQFLVTLNKVWTTPITVTYATSNGSATAPTDYLTSSSSITFLAGETSKTINVPVIGDTVFEPVEGFLVNLTSATGGALIIIGTGVGTIVDNDPQPPAPPTIAVADVVIVEGDGGTQNAGFVITLSNAWTAPVSVNYSTADGSAKGPSDYTPVSGTVTFLPGETSKTINVPVVNDLVFEQVEGFLFQLSGASGAAIVDDLAVGTIIDNDPVGSGVPPTVSIADALGFEGDNGTSGLSFTVTLSKPAIEVTTVTYTTSPGSALAGEDYIVTSGSVTFAVGETSKTITIQMVNNLVFEGVEGFYTTLTSAVGATILQATAIGTIIDNDPAPPPGPPTIAISDALVFEGNTGTVPANFTVTLSHASAGPVSVKYATSNGSATTPSDYQVGGGIVTFAPGETSRTITVQVVGDTTMESVEGFMVNLFDAQGATLAVSTAVGTIIDDDLPNGISINDVVIIEPFSGSRTAQMTLTLQNASTSPVTVQYQTEDGTGTVGDIDYLPMQGTVQFAPGETTKTITVQVWGDTKVEGVEGFTVRLFAAIGASIADETGIVTILDSSFN